MTAARLRRFRLAAANKIIEKAGQARISFRGRTGLRMQPCGRLTTPPRNEVELVTNSVFGIPPGIGMHSSRARSATLDNVLFGFSLGLRIVRHLGLACRVAGPPPQFHPVPAAF